MTQKIALQGFDRLTLFPVTKDDADGYAVGDGFRILGAQEMTKENDVSSQKFYADDGLYMEVKSFNAVSTKITALEMPLETMERLGFGRLGADGAFYVNPQGENRGFALTFRCLNTGGGYRLYKFFKFTVNEVKESAARTKGKDVNLANFTIIGNFTKRVRDGEIYCVKDVEGGADVDWLDGVSDV